VVKGDGWLLWLLVIGNQSTQDVDKAVDWRTVARRLNLRNVLTFGKQSYNWLMIVSMMARLRSNRRSLNSSNRCFMLRLSLVMSWIPTVLSYCFASFCET
jgi:hypothetical protein